jgi:purine-cytosine permease-like protein
MKWLILAALVAVLGALASAGFFMLRKDVDGDARDKRMARALAVRVGLSITIFIVVLLSYAMGWIQPTGVPVSRG